MKVATWLLPALVALVGLMSGDGAAWAAEKYRPDSIEFTGTNGLAFPPDARSSIAAGGTIEFWAAPDWKTAPPHDPVIVSSAGPGGISFAIAMLRDRDGIAFVAGQQEYVVAFDFSDGKLHHVAVSQLADGIVVLINGQVVGSSELSAIEMPVAGFWVGSLDGAAHPFLGVVAGLRIWGEVIDREALVRYALADVFDDDHPDLDVLTAISDFGNRQLLLVDLP
jgi:hypothetical protein